MLIAYVAASAADAATALLRGLLDPILGNFLPLPLSTAPWHLRSGSEATARPYSPVVTPMPFRLNH
jgi:hypothetical protein